MSSDQKSEETQSERDGPAGDAARGGRAGGQHIRTPGLATKLLLGLIVALGTLVIGLLAGELVLRTTMSKVDYLQPTIVRDTVLGRHIEPGSGGYDAWGFRNARVPGHADVVGIGDSQTFGWTAPASESWPAWLARDSRYSVYNLALGGYGPFQYRYLFHHYAVRLHPEIVVFGLYLGNDIADAYNFIRRKERRAERGGNAAATTNSSHVHVFTGGHRLFAGVRYWLASHSMVYQVLKYRLPRLIGFLRFHEARSVEGPDVIVLRDPVSTTMLEPDRVFRDLDLSDPRIQTGLDSTEAVFRDLGSSCRTNGIRCVVLLIPTKESVYAPLSARRLDKSDLERLGRVVRAETKLRTELERSFRHDGLDCIDPLPRMQEAVSRERLYPTDEGSHPLGPGYRVLAHAVLAGLDSIQPDTLRSERPVRATGVGDSGR